MTTAPRVRPVILDVGGGSGEWSRPYRLAGYDVRIIDPTVWPFLTAETYVPDETPVQGVLLAPPCTEFAASGARWWDGKDPALLQRAIATVRAFLRIVACVSPAWWALENPVGRLGRCVPELGRYAYSWQPWEFGDAETKRTCMWGNHNRPEPTVTSRPDQVNARVHRMGPSPDRARLRSITPAGFARAFMEANP